MSLNIHQRREICDEAKRAVATLRVKLLLQIETVLGVSKDDPSVHRYIDGVLYSVQAKVKELTNILNRVYHDSIP